jgi:protein-tyrosine phosphatase
MLLDPSRSDLEESHMTTSARSAAARALSVDGLLNVRDLGGLTTRDGRQMRRGRVIRSDNLRGLTDDGAVALVRDLQPQLVVDLRTEQECAREGCGLSHVEHVRYVNVPLQPKAALSDAQVAAGLATNLYDDYVLQVLDNSEQLVRGLQLLAETGNLPAVIHCTAGKDRTGVLVALLLDLLRVQREQVIADYAATTSNMPGIMARIRSSPFFQANGLAAAPAWIFESRPETMRDFLAWLDEEHGGSERWALRHGLGSAAITHLRTQLLEPEAGSADLSAPEAG